MGGHGLEGGGGHGLEGVGSRGHRLERGWGYGLERGCGILCRFEARAVVYLTATGERMSSVTLRPSIYPLTQSLHNGNAGRLWWLGKVTEFRVMNRDICNDK